MIKVNNLKKSYNNEPVLDIPTLDINLRESFGLVGNNGAGKTTFFRLLLDLIIADEGEITSKDKNVHKSEHWKDYTGAFLDEGFLIEFLTAEEYFTFLAELKNVNKSEMKDFLESKSEFFNGEILNQKKYIREMSKGNKQKVGIVAALLGTPEIIILDEPFANIDPSTQFRLKNILKELKSAGNITMLISSHDLNHITDVCDRIAILEKGKIVHDIQSSENTLEELESYFSVQ